MRRVSKLLIPLLLCITLIASVGAAKRSISTFTGSEVGLRSLAASSFDVEVPLGVKYVILTLDGTLSTCYHADGLVGQAKSTITLGNTVLVQLDLTSTVDDPPGTKSIALEGTKFKFALPNAWAGEVKELELKIWTQNVAKGDIKIQTIEFE